ncbi:hypothetical protein [Kitasatospora cheerisanensis]|uniref:hypothetical protein n=1 Tax=Kitasatospora cheerisanensis TaxID=81942 RepID=UPI00056A8942|nr:hypothetical protein [Kitasatospora cheerisanensis]
MGEQDAGASKRGGNVVGPGAGSRYARVERERRFLLGRAPEPGAVTCARLITDRYVDGTRLRLRHVERIDTGECAHKLTQKIPAPPGTTGPEQGLITNLYLSVDEYALLLDTLPGRELTKTRLSVPPLGVDVFDGRLLGLVLAEAEFDSAEAAETFVPPTSCLAEVTDDPRFTGGSLARADRGQLRGWLADYGLVLA